MGICRFIRQFARIDGINTGKRKSRDTDVDDMIIATSSKCWFGGVTNIECHQHPLPPNSEVFKIKVFGNYKNFDQWQYVEFCVKYQN